MRFMSILRPLRLAGPLAVSQDASIAAARIDDNGQP